jgi:predicted lactoylglutathione lyase
MDLGYFETSLPVKDIEASMAFYEALGFERADYDTINRTATVVLGDCRLGLYQGCLDPDRPQLTFWEGPVEAVAQVAERAALKTRVALRHDAAGGGGLKLDDPDDNPLHFIRLKAAPAARPRERALDETAGWYEASLPVKDVAASTAFYEALGFVVVVSEVNGRRLTLQNADSRIGLFQGFLRPDRPQLIFWQGDIAAMASRVRQAGLGFHVEPRGDNEHGSFMLADPDGHPLYFIHMPGVTRAQPDPTRAGAA